ncbi:unnamed protein product [Sympodiomycopsis kandeliae]
MALQDGPTMIKYGDGPRQVIHIHHPPQQTARGEAPPLLIFLHGGAWRSESIEEHVPMAKRLASHGVVVALVEYRLSLRDEQTDTIRDQHPAHLQDAFAALRALLLSPTSSAAWNGTKVVLSGHSVGAWMVLAALLDCDQAVPHGLPPNPVLGSATERETVRGKIRAWVGLDGIYDVQTLLDEYPDYAGFVSQAFIDPKHSQPLPEHKPGSDKRLSSVSLPQWPVSETSNLPHIHIVHSRDDDLLTYRQSIEASETLVAQYKVDKSRVQSIPIPRRSFGAAGTDYGDQTVKHAPPIVNIDLTSLKGTHSGMLQTEEFADWLAALVHSETQ